MSYNFFKVYFSALKEHIDMDAEEETTNVGQQRKNAPFGMWKYVYSLSFIDVALAQLYELWV